MGFVRRTVWFVVLALGLSSPAMGQDQPRRPQASAKPRPPQKKSPRTSKPRPAVPPGATSDEAKAGKPTPAPACERSLRRAAVSPGHLGIMVEATKAGTWRLLDVLPGSLGAREGLLPGDILVGLVGVPEGPSLPARLAKLQKKERFALRVERDSRLMVVPIRWSGPATGRRPDSWRRCVTGRLGLFEKGDDIRLELRDGMKPPPPGTEAQLWWVLEKKHGPFGPGVRIGLGQVRVGRGAPSTLQLKMLKETHVTYNGKRVSVPEPGKRVHLRYERGRLL